MFQRENINFANEKRSLSKNSAKCIDIKNRTRSSYSNRGKIVSSKEKKDKDGLKRYPQYRGEYFLGRKNSQKQLMKAIN